MSERLQVLIYGSCVSRDSFEYFDAEKFELQAYHARHSLISAFSRASAESVADAQVTSRFQRRMLEEDAQALLTRRLYAGAPRPDVFLWDLVDERMGVVELPTGGHLTVSNELINSGVEPPPGTRHIPFGTDEHFALWSDSLRRFYDLLSSRGMRTRTVLLVAPWATATAAGRPTPSSHGLTAAEANRLFERYYVAATDLPKLRVLEMSDLEAVGAEEHQWGPAPFHYTEDFYRAVACRFAAMTDGDRSHG